MTNASIADSLAVHGGNTHSNQDPFEYDLGEGLEIKLFSTWSPVSGYTWSQLQIIVGGLWDYHIMGKHYKASIFDVYDYEQEYIYPVVGRGVIQDPSQSLSEQVLSHSISKRDAHPQLR